MKPIKINYLQIDFTMRKKIRIVHRDALQQKLPSLWDAADTVSHLALLNAADKIDSSSYNRHPLLSS
jgi:hypothetical protein